MRKLKCYLFAVLWLISCLEVWGTEFPIFQVDGIYYQQIADGKTAVRVTSLNGYRYAGDIVIPAVVAYEGKEWRVTEIGDYAFSVCGELTSIDLGEVTKIGEYAFDRCHALTTVRHSAVDSLGARAFQSCEKLQTFDLSRVSYIGNGAFIACESLTDINLSHVGTLMLYAFSGCTGLTAIDLAQIKWLQPQTFKSCTNLTDIDFGEVERVGTGNFENCSSLTAVNLKGVRKLGDRGFYRCERLESVDLKNVETIGAFAFLECPALRTITLSTAVPPHFKDKEGQPVEMCFDKETFEQGILQVPAGSLLAYQQAPIWRKFKRMVEVGESTAVQCVDNSSVVVSCQGTTLSVTGMQRGATIKIFTVDGTLVTSAIATGDRVTFRLPAVQVYVVKVDRRSWRVRS